MNDGEPPLGLVGALVPDAPGTPKVVMLVDGLTGTVPGTAGPDVRWVERRKAKADVEVSAVALIAIAAAVASVVLKAVMIVSL